MRIITGDVFAEMRHGYDAIVVPTNGEVTHSGLAVLGPGPAKAAATVFGLWFREFLGAAIERGHNHVAILDAQDDQGCGLGPGAPRHIFTFPVRALAADRIVDLGLCARSAWELRLDFNRRRWTRAVMAEPDMAGVSRDWQQLVLELACFGDELTMVRTPPPVVADKA